MSIKCHILFGIVLASGETPLHPPGGASARPIPLKPLSHQHDLDMRPRDDRLKKKLFLLVRTRLAAVVTWSDKVARQRGNSRQEVA